MSTAIVPASAAAAAPQVGAGPKTEGPSEKVLAHAAKIAMEQDKPILLDYYKHTQVGGHAFLGEDKDTKEKILVKNTDEYTSPVTKMFKAKEDYIIVTENSVYIVSGAIKKKEISTGGRA
jgi:mitochondrial fission protein ELM1